MSSPFMLFDSFIWLFRINLNLKNNEDGNQNFYRDNEELHVIWHHKTADNVTESPFTDEIANEIPESFNLRIRRRRADINK